MLLVAAVTPARGADRFGSAVIRLYRRHLTRFISACPSTPSCSEYALIEVERRGARRGLHAAAGYNHSRRRQ